MTSRYQMTITADSLPELVGALTSAAAMLQAGDASSTLTAELSQLVEQTPAPAGLQTPPPDYVAAGLTDYQQIQLRQAQSSSQPMYVPPQLAPAIGEPSRNAATAVQDGPPFCQIHQKPYEWKGGAISKSGKRMPLWSCPERNCPSPAVWPADR